MFSDRPLRANGLQDYVPPFSLRRAQLVNDSKIPEENANTEKPITKWTNNLAPNMPVQKNQVNSTATPLPNGFDIEKSVDNGIGDIEARRRKLMRKPFDANAALAANWPFDEAGKYRPTVCCNHNHNTVVPQYPHKHHTSSPYEPRSQNKLTDLYGEAVNSNQQYHQGNQHYGQRHRYQTPNQQQILANQQAALAINPQARFAQQQAALANYPPGYAHYHSANHATPGYTNQQAGLVNHYHSGPSNHQDASHLNNQQMTPSNHEASHQNHQQEVADLQSVIRQSNQPESSNQKDGADTQHYHESTSRNPNQVDHQHHPDAANQPQQQTVYTNQYLPSMTTLNTPEKSNQHLQNFSNSYYNQVANNVQASQQHSVPQDQPYMKLTNTAMNTPRTKPNYHPMHYVNFHPEAAYMHSHVQPEQMPQVSQPPHPDANNINNYATEGGAIQANIAEAVDA